MSERASRQLAPAYVRVLLNTTKSSDTHDNSSNESRHPNDLKGGPDRATNQRVAASTNTPGVGRVDGEHVEECKLALQPCLCSERASVGVSGGVSEDLATEASEQASD